MASADRARPAAEDGSSCADPIRSAVDRLLPWAIHDDLYSHQCLGVGAAPGQGWKVHVSATPASAARVLDASFSVLLAAGARFKVTRSLHVLADLNSGEHGLTQIGKFITVYPSDDAQAVRLALELHEATRGLAGPRVPSDRPLREGSIVHYRYGAMHALPETLATSDAAMGGYDMLDGEGRLMCDTRGTFYTAPSGVIDPFEASGAYQRSESPGILLNARYLVLDALSESPRGGVFRAMDLAAHPARLVLIKEFRHDVCVDESGRDARAWADNEQRMLMDHANDPSFPAFYEAFNAGGDRYVAIEYVAGTSLAEILSRESESPSRLPMSEVVAVGLATAGCLAHLHDIGVVFRDLKPANVLRTPEGEYRLIDFGIAHDLSTPREPGLSMGTAEFCSPEQFNGGWPRPTDDVFSWGATLYRLAGGLAGEREAQHPVPRTAIRELNHDLTPPVASVIDRAVAWDAAQRWSSIHEARRALTSAMAMSTIDRRPSRLARSTNRTDPASVPVPVPVGASTTSPLTPAEALRKASEVGDALAADAEERADGTCWAARSPVGDTALWSPDLYSGVGGIALFLGELADRTGNTSYADLARAAARWLAGPTWGKGRAQHGLYGGEPGIAYVFIRLAQLLDEPGYVTAAELRMRRIRDAPFVTSDLMHGRAGTLLALISLHVATGEGHYLDDARSLADDIESTALADPHSRHGIYWEISSVEPGGPSAPYLGLLHGAAGIGLAFAELAAVTHEWHHLQVAERTAEMLVHQMRHVATARPGGRSPDETVAWPRCLGDESAGLQALCHGAGGIGWFLLRLHSLDSAADYLDYGEMAARGLAARVHTETRSCACHGLTGTGHLMLTCLQATGASRWLDLAHDCGARLESFASRAVRGLRLGGHGHGVARPVARIRRRGQLLPAPRRPQ